MIAAILLGLHVCAGVYAFFSRKKKAGWVEGSLALAFMGVVFSVGWTLTTMLSSLLVGPEGLAEWFNRDTVSLTLLTVLEGVFYWLLLRPRKDTSTEA
jgi:uncharacterized membrane protein YhdT